MGAQCGRSVASATRSRGVSDDAAGGLDAIVDARDQRDADAAATRIAGRGVARGELRAQLALDLKAELDGCFARLEWVDVNGDGLATADEGATRTAQPVLSHVTNANIMDYSDDPTTPDTFDRFRVTGSM